MFVRVDKLASLLLQRLLLGCKLCSFSLRRCRLASDLGLKSFEFLSLSLIFKICLFLFSHQHFSFVNQLLLDPLTISLKLGLDLLPLPSSSSSHFLQLLIFLADLVLDLVKLCRHGLALLLTLLEVRLEGTLQVILLVKISGLVI